MAHVDMQIGQSVTLNLSATLSGTTAPLENQIVWSTNDQTLLTLTPSPDGMTCEVNAPGPNTGSCTVYADSGALQDFCTFIVSGYADTIVISPGSPS